MTPKELVREKDMERRAREITLRFGIRYQHPHFRYWSKYYTKIFGFPCHMGSRIRAYYVMRLLSPKKSEKILGAGCGSGGYAIEIGVKGAFVVGVDISKESVTQASEVADFIGISDRVKFQVADLCHLPFNNNSFDKALCVDVLEHIKRDDDAIAEVSRVLKIGGIFVLHVPNQNQIHYMHALFNTYGHVRKGYTRKSLSRLLNKNNLTIIYQKDTFKTFGTLSWEIHKLFRFHWSVFPFLYPISRFDAVSKRRGNGLLIASKKVRRAGGFKKSQLEVT